MADLKSTLMDIRKARRAMKLREETDPSVVAKSLETILREVIAMRSANQGSFGQAAMNELENIRSDLIAQQINAGSKTSLLIGKYSLVIDELRQLNENQEVESKLPTDGIDSVVKNAFGSIASAIPSAESITSALITANPFLGYGAKIITDIFRSSSERRDDMKSRREMQLKALKEQEQYLLKQLENADKEEELLENQEQTSTDESEAVDDCKLDCTQNEVIASLLEDVRAEMHKLYLVWSDSDDDSSEKDQKIEVSTESEDDEEKNILLSTETELIEDGDLERELIENQNETNELLERLLAESEETNDLERQRIDLLEFSDRETDLESRADLIAPDMNVNEKRESGGLSFLEAAGLGRFFPALGLGAGLGSFLGTAAAGAGVVGKGMLGMFSAAVGPLKALWSITKGLLRVGGWIASAVAVFDLIDGMINAEDIVGKSDDQISTLERSMAGIANASAGILDWFESIANYFLDDDVDLPDADDIYSDLDRIKETLKENTDNWLDRFTEQIKEDWNFLLDGISNWFSENNPLTKLRNWMSNTATGATDAANAYLNDPIDRTVMTETFNEIIVEERESFLDRLMNTGSAMSDVSAAYLNINPVVEETEFEVQTEDQTVRYEFVEDSETFLERAIESIERENSEQIINNENNSAVVAPVSNVTNNNLNQTVASPRMSNSINTEPTFRRFLNDSQRLSY